MATQMSGAPAKAALAAIIYHALLYLALPVMLIRLVIRGLRNHAYWHRWPERLGFVRPGRERYAVWLHAVSVGEVNAATPLIKALLARYPEHGVLVTTATPTGSDQVWRTFRGRVDHCYAPYDLPDAVRRFLTRTRPAATIIMETEIWPNLIQQCRNADIAVLCANVRLSERSFGGYRRVRRVVGPALAQINALAAQSRQDAARLMELGARPAAVQITGSIKFEVTLPGDLDQVARQIRHEWGAHRPVVLAGSTHDGEEEAMLCAFDRLRHRHPDLLLVLVPRHPERFEEVVRLGQRAGYRVARRSEQHGDIPRSIEILVGDTMGELQMLYAAVDVAVIAGSFAPVGGHNMLEACAVGVPVVFGPYVANFLEISALVVERGAGRSVTDDAGLYDMLDQYLCSSELRAKAGTAGRALVAENRGALARTLALFDPYLAPTTHGTFG